MLAMIRIPGRLLIFGEIRLVLERGITSRALPRQHSIVMSLSRALQSELFLWYGEA